MTKDRIKETTITIFTLTIILKNSNHTQKNLEGLVMVVIATNNDVSFYAREESLLVFAIYWKICERSSPITRKKPNWIPGTMESVAPFLIYQK